MKRPGLALCWGTQSRPVQTVGGMAIPPSASISAAVLPVWCVLSPLAKEGQFAEAVVRQFELLGYRIVRGEPTWHATSEGGASWAFAKALALQRLQKLWPFVSNVVDLSRSPFGDGAPLPWAKFCM